jgi:hypothetical protein
VVFVCLGAIGLTDTRSLAQISFPGQYPGQYPNGRYPQSGSSVPFPGRGRNSQSPVITLTGVLRQISTSDMTMAIETDDKRAITVSLTNSTQYYRASGGSAKLGELQPGDRLNVDATQDDYGYFHARSITQLQAGTPEEHSAAAPPANSSPNSDEADRDDGPPRLRRNSSSSSVESSADNVNGVTRRPEPPAIDTNNNTGGVAGSRSPASGDAVIDKTREAAFSFSKTLPNFVVKQLTNRYETLAARGGQTSWRILDTISADVISEGGAENYRNILVNGKPPKEDLAKTGTWSTGEYQSVLLDVLSLASGADFHNRRTTSIVNRDAWRYDFSVEQANSHWQVDSPTQTYKPGYAGVIWIDKESSRVLRIEMAARNVPRTFPFDTVESAINYDFVLIGDGRFVMPTHSEVLTCERGTSICDRNTIDFRDYKKFSADSSITFDSPPDK